MSAEPTDERPSRGVAFREAFAHHRFAFTFIALAATVLFLTPLLRREVFALRDHFDYFQPLRWFTAEELKAGRLPLWNPYSASGEPWLANPQTGVFYPPAWIFLLLPFATAFMLHLLAHLALLGWATYLLLQRTLSRGAALVGAIAAMFSGPVLSLLDVSNNFCTLAWIPLALWCAAERAWKRGGAVLALAFLAGEPFFAALAAALFVIVGLSTADWRGQTRGVALAALIAIGLSGVQLLPFVEYVAGSDRTGSAMDDTLILRDSMSWNDWLRVVVPPEGFGRLSGLSQQFIPVVYVGLAAAILALAGAMTARRRKEAAGWLALLIFAIVVSTGPELLTRLPLTIFRYPARLVPIGALAIAALAAIGWDRLRRDRRWLDLLVILILIADLLPRTRLLFTTQPWKTDVVPYDRAIGARGKILKFGEPDALHRAEWMSGYLNLYDRRFDAFTAAPLVSSAYDRFYRQLLASPKPEGYAKAAVTHIISSYALPQRWPLVIQEGNIGVYRNPQAWPMAAHFVRNSAALRYATWELDTSSATIGVNAPADGVLVLRQQAAPGWSVEVDGVPAESLVIDSVFRGVEVPKGPHEVVWRYRPRSVIVGGVMTIVTLVSLQVPLFVKRRK